MTKKRHLLKVGKKYRVMSILRSYITELTMLLREQLERLKRAINWRNKINKQMLYRKMRAKRKKTTHKVRKNHLLQICPLMKMSKTRRKKTC